MPPSSSLTSPITAQVPHKTKQAILSGEFIEFDPLLPENPSLLTKIFLGFRYYLRVNMSISLPPPMKKRCTLTRSIGGCLRSQFSVQSSLPRFPTGLLKCLPTRCLSGLLTANLPVLTGFPMKESGQQPFNKLGAT